MRLLSSLKKYMTGPFVSKKKNEGNYRQVHKLPENKDSQPGDEDKLSFGRQSAEGHFLQGGF